MSRRPPSSRPLTPVQKSKFSNDLDNYIFPYVASQNSKFWLLASRVFSERATKLHELLEMRS
jgi:hypothetical protein